MMERKAKRSLAKRELSDWFKRVESEKRDITASNGTAPHDNSIRNSTCVLAPEVSEGRQQRLDSSCLLPFGF